jgi:hypothetical protein
VYCSLRFYVEVLEKFELFELTVPMGYFLNEFCVRFRPVLSSREMRYYKHGFVRKERKGQRMDDSPGK